MGPFGCIEFEWIRILWLEPPILMETAIPTNFSEASQQQRQILGLQKWKG